MKNLTPAWGSSFYLVLTFGDGVARARCCAAAAVDALIGVNVIDVAFRDSVNRANTHASAAGYASVGNNMCHCSRKIKLVKQIKQILLQMY